MCKANSFLLGVLPDIKIMVAERKGLADWPKKPSTPEGVPLRSAIRGGTRVYTLKEYTFNAFRNGLLKPTGNVGQQAKNSAQPSYSQAH